MTTTISKPGLTVWMPDADADDLSAALGDAFCAEYDGVWLRTEGNAWEAVEYTQVIRVGYPGYPDQDERMIGHGTASSPLEARWAAMRAVERARVGDDAEDWLMDEALNVGNPDGDPDWWKAPKGA